MFGNFSGWWLVRGRRPEVGASVSIPSRWNVELQAAGFTGAEHVLDGRRRAIPSSPLQSCRAPPARHQRNSSSVTVICRGREKGHLSLDDRLSPRSQGLEVAVIQLGEDVPPDAPVLIMLEAEAPFFDRN